MGTDDDREAILRRRAFFVSSALTATLGASLGSVLTGCPQEKPTSGPEPPSVLVPETPKTAAPTAAPPTPDPQPSEPTGEFPPLDVPDDVSAKARLHFENLARDVPAIHAELAAAAKLLSTPCPIEDAACDAHWESIARHLAKAKDALSHLGPRCPGSSKDAKRFDERLAVHAAAIRGRIARVEERAASQLAGDPAAKRWEAHQRAAAVPRPCLKFACEDW
jgi:hypothetical protein